MRKSEKILMVIIVILLIISTAISIAVNTPTENIPTSMVSRNFIEIDNELQETIIDEEKVINSETINQKQEITTQISEPVTEEIFLQDEEDDTIGTIEIPKLELKAPIKEGIDEAILAEYVGHFPNSSVWDGNVCLASHNRGSEVKHFFENIYKLVNGDTIIYKTKLGERSYQVTAVKEIESTDWSVTESKTEEKNTITLLTCITNQPEKRLCVIAEEKN